MTAGDCKAQPTFRSLLNETVTMAHNRTLMCDSVCAAILVAMAIPLFWILVVIAVLITKEIVSIPSDAAQYWYATVGAFVGAFLSAVWTYFIYSLVQIKRRNEARQGLIKSLRFSLQLTGQAIEQLQASNPPSFLLDVAALIRWIDRAHDVLSDEAIAKVDGLRYQLDHANQKLAMIYSIAAESGNPAAIKHPEYQSLQRHLVQIDKWTKERIADIEREPTRKLFWP